MKTGPFRRDLRRSPTVVHRITPTRILGCLRVPVHYFFPRPPTVGVSANSLPRRSGASSVSVLKTLTASFRRTLTSPSAGSGRHRHQGRRSGGRSHTERCLSGGAGLLLLADLRHFSRGHCSVERPVGRSSVGATFSIALASRASIGRPGRSSVWSRRPVEAGLRRNDDRRELTQSSRTYGIAVERSRPIWQRI